MTARGAHDLPLLLNMTAGALKRYGHHDESCDAADSDEPCKCGFNQAVKNFCIQDSGAETCLTPNQPN